MFHLWLIVIIAFVYPELFLSASQSCSHSTTATESVLGPSSKTCIKQDISEEEMKRRMDNCEVNEIKRTGNWSLGLIDSIKNPDLIVRKSDNVVVIRDKFPKAKFHYLVIPEEDIASILKLNASHVGLLEQFGRVLEQVREEHCGVRLRAGFHAVPSMQRLHMHVISEDMLSPCLKTKAHWNSFTTSFFIPYEDLLQELRDKGSITRISQEEHKALLATPLKCNQCDFTAKNMPQLKEHLLKHVLFR